MYGKLFAQMYDGTLASRGPWEALVTFQQLVILAGRDGIVDMTPEALSRRTTIPLAIILSGLAALQEPDPESRTPTEEGRRIVPLSEGRSWGWRIVNHARYRQLQREEERRAYHAEYWRVKRSTGSTPQHPSTPLNTTQHLNQTQQTQPNSTNSTNGSMQEAESSSPPPGGGGEGGLNTPQHPSTPLNTALAAVPEDFSQDIQALRRAAHSLESFDAELRTLLAGRHPRAEGATPEDVGWGARALALKGADPSRLANYVRIARQNRLDGVPPPVSRPGGDVTDAEMAALEAKLRAEEVR